MSLTSLHLVLVWKHGFLHRRPMNLAFAQLLSCIIILWSAVSFFNSLCCIFNSYLFSALENILSEVLIYPLVLVVFVIISRLLSKL